MHGKASASTPVHGNRLYNSKEARALLGGISERTFRALTASKALTTKRQGARVYVSQEAIDAYIAALPSATDEDSLDEEPDPATAPIAAGTAA
jgi:hypothetical protein